MNYGGRGIKVCDRWNAKLTPNAFKNFYEDMGPKPGPEYTIERLDNDKDYSPSNCVWAIESLQARNRSNTNKITFNGETMCLKDWAARLGVDRGSIYRRMGKGQSFEEIYRRYTTVGPRRCVALAVEEE
jgi:hypothetical protein